MFSQFKVKVCIRDVHGRKAAKTAFDSSTVLTVDEPYDMIQEIIIFPIDKYVLIF